MFEDEILRDSPWLGVDASRLTRRAWLKPVTDDDVELLFRVESSSAGAGWRVGMPPPHPHTYADRLWRGVWRQDIVIERRRGVPVGWMICYAADLANRHAGLAAVNLIRQPSRAFAEGAGQFISSIFGENGFRILYCDVAEFNLPSIGRFLKNVASDVAVIPRFYYRDGKEWSLHKFILDSEQWWRQPWSTIGRLRT